MTRNNPNGSPLDDEEFDPLADDAPSPEVEAIIAERDEYRDRFMRALADAENARKRADKDRRDAEQYGGSRLARDLLPVHDALSRALDAAGIAVRKATGTPPTLDDVFLALTGRTLREAGEGAPADDDTDVGASSTDASPTTEKTGALR